MPDGDFFDRLEQLERMGIPISPSFRQKMMTEVLGRTPRGDHGPIAARTMGPVPAKSAQLSERKSCPRQTCGRCDRQFLSPTQIAQLGKDHQSLDRNTFEGRIDNLSKDVLSDFTFIKVFGERAIRRGISLPRDEFCKILDDAFPHMLRYDYLKTLDPKDKSLQDLRDCHESGLRYFALIRDDFDKDKANDLFISNFFRLRVHYPPSYFLTVDNSELEVGWSLLAFKVVSAECFVEFSTPDTTSYYRIVDPVEGGLHEDLAFSATRAYLLVESQAIIYKQLRQLASRILAPDVPPQPLFIEVGEANQKQVAVTLLSMHFQAAVIPMVEELIASNKNALSAYRAHAQDNIKDIQKFCTWLGNTKCPPQKALPMAFSHHTLRRMRHVALLQLVRKDFTDLQSAAQNFLKGSASMYQVLAAWESAEDSLSILCRLLCQDALELSPYFHHYRYIIFAHYDDWHSIYTCKDGHVSFTDYLAAGSAMVQLLCPGWTMPYKARMVLGYVANDRGECFYSGLRNELVSRFSLIVHAYAGLQSFNTCTDAPTHSTSLVRKLHRCFEFEFDTGACSGLVERLPAMKESDPYRWADMLWQKALDTVEDTWTRQDMEVKWRRHFREIFGMPDRQDESRLPSANISSHESSTARIGLNHRADLGQLVEPFVASDRVTRPNRRVCKSGNMMSGLWASDDTLRDFGVSEGIKYGTPQKERPSQFDEQVPSAKGAKRRNAPHHEHHSVPVASQKEAGVDKERPQILSFRDPVLYGIWRQIFPMPGSNARQRIKWDDLRRVMHAEPLYFEEIRSTGVEFRFRREARDGYPVVELGFHQPHNSWVEKNLLKGIRKNIHRFTGWVAETFVLIDQE